MWWILIYCYIDNLIRLVGIWIFIEKKIYCIMDLLVCYYNIVIVYLLSFWYMNVLSVDNVKEKINLINWIDGILFVLW